MAGDPGQGFAAGATFLPASDARRGSRAEKKGQPGGKQSLASQC